MAERRDKTRPQRMLGAIQGAVQLLGLDECQLLSPVDFLNVVFSSRVRQSKRPGSGYTDRFSRYVCTPFCVLTNCLVEMCSGLVFRGKGISSVKSMDVDLSDMVDRWRLRGGCGTQGRPSCCTRACDRCTGVWVIWKIWWKMYCSSGSQDNKDMWLVSGRQRRFLE